MFQALSLEIPDVFTVLLTECTAREAQAKLCYLFQSHDSKLEVTVHLLLELKDLDCLKRRIPQNTHASNRFSECFYLCVILVCPVILALLTVLVYFMALLCFMFFYGCTCNTVFEKLNYYLYYY